MVRRLACSRRRKKTDAQSSSQLGTLLERRYTERALIAAKEQAETAAALAEQAMRQAQAADRAKSQFLATMTHELRTPLSVIRTAAHNLGGRVISNANQVQRYGALIAEQTEKLTGKRIKPAATRAFSSASKSSPEVKGISRATGRLRSFTINSSPARTRFKCALKLFFRSAILTVRISGIS